VSEGIIVAMPKQWTKEIMLAVLDTYLEGLDRGYTLKWEEKEEESK
jgi:hypothetical protein